MTGAKPVIDPAEAARKLEQEGDLRGAVRELNRLAEAAEPAERAQYSLRAAMLLSKGNFIEEAQRALSSVDTAALPESQRTQSQLLEAKLLLTQQKAQEALAILQTVSLNESDAASAFQYYQLRADAQRLLSRPQLAVIDLINSEGFSNNPAELRANQNKLWPMLTDLPLETLRNMAKSSGSDDVQGWARLAELNKTYQLPGMNLSAEIKDWRIRYPLHKAAEEIVQAILALKQDLTERPQHIALLLPQSGSFAKSGSAVRDGFMAAYYARGDDSYAPNIRVYETGDTVEGADAAYDRAIQDGADFVVGPLIKDAVTKLASNEQLPVPTLALNIATNIGRPPTKLYQFGLLPEDEARQVAEKAWLDGHNQAIVFLPDDSRGQRLLASFQDYWLKLGGSILETQAYKGGEKEFSDSMQRLLNIDESNDRYKQLKQLLKTDIKFDPRRRGDADFVFVAATPAQARQTRPQLKFYYASDLPVYATSSIFTGIADPAVDHDLNDILFCDMPWTLSSPPSPLWSRIAQIWGDDSYSVKRLYAFGIDSYNIIPHLHRLSTFRFQQARGETGILSLNELNQVQRQLTWARFAHGTPQVLEQPMTGTTAP